MGGRRLGLGLLVCALVLSLAVPSQAARQLRRYKGKTSQDHNISFFVKKTDSGRFVNILVVRLTLTCDDLTTQEWVTSFGLGKTAPITDGAVAYDQVDYWAVHLAGHLGPRHGEGTLSMATTAFDAEEHAQLCTTGEMTWEVDLLPFDAPVVTPPPGTHSEGVSLVRIA